MKILETDIIDLQGIKNIQRYDTIKVFEGWDNECIKNYREFINKNLTLTGCLKILEKDMKKSLPKNFRKRKTIWNKDNYTSCSIFVKRR